MPLLDHVGVKVTDLDRSIRFYTELFGFELVDRRMLGSSNVEAAGLKVTGESLIFLLYSPEFSSHSPEERGGVDHFCLTFNQDNFEAILDRIETFNVKKIGNVVNRTGGTGRSPSIYILDPDNNQIEVKTGLSKSME